MIHKYNYKTGDFNNSPKSYRIFLKWSRTSKLFLADYLL